MSTIHPQPDRRLDEYVSARLSTVELERLRAVASIEDRSVSNVVRRAVKQYIALDEENR